MTCGVYAIIDINGERYVGSSYNIEARLKGHWKSLEDNTHGNRFLQRAYNKHGAKFFRNEVLEICSRETRYIREQFHMDISSRYNLSKTAEGTTGVKFTKKRRKAMSERMKGNKHLLGHTHTKDSKNKISSSLKGRKPSKLARQKSKERMIKRNTENPPMKGRDFSEHHRKAISAAAKQRCANPKYRRFLSKIAKRNNVLRKRNKDGTWK